MPTWNGKPLSLDDKRNADGEMLDLDLNMYQIIDILEYGIIVNKRKSGIIEKWYHRGKSIYIVAVEFHDDYWLVRHIGKIRATKRKLEIMKDKEEEI